MWIWLWIGLLAVCAVDIALHWYYHRRLSALLGALSQALRDCDAAQQARQQELEDHQLELLAIIQSVRHYAGHRTELLQ